MLHNTLTGAGLVFWGLVSSLVSSPHTARHRYPGRTPASQLSQPTQPEATPSLAALVDRSEQIFLGHVLAVHKLPWLTQGSNQRQRRTLLTVAVKERLMAPATLKTAFLALPLGEDSQGLDLPVGSDAIFFARPDLLVSRRARQATRDAWNALLQGEQLHESLLPGALLFGASGETLCWPSTWPHKPDIEPPAVSAEQPSRIELEAAQLVIRAAVRRSTPSLKCHFVTTGPSPWSVHVHPAGNSLKVSQTPEQLAELWSALDHSAPNTWPEKLGSMHGPDESYLKFELRSSNGVRRIQVFRAYEHAHPSERFIRRRLEVIHLALPGGPPERPEFW